MADDDNTTDPTREQTPTGSPNLTRRALITGGSLIGAGLVVGGTLLGQQIERSSAAGAKASPTPTTNKPPMRTFASTGLTTPVVTSWRTGTTAPGLVFVTQQVAGFNGSIMEESGEPVWIEPTTANLTDLKVQQFEGRPVLTYWTGTSTGGHGSGSGTILDDTYAKVATVRAGNGLDADLHEFNLTDRGTALITIYTVVKTDLSAVGGVTNGYVYDCHVQEVDVRTGKVLLDWSALDHIPIGDTHLTLTQDPGHDGTAAGRAFDAYHLNAVEEDGDALLVSARHTHTVYSIDRTTGKVRWRFGGKQSDIARADGCGLRVAARRATPPRRHDHPVRQPPLFGNGRSIPRTPLQPRRDVGHRDTRADVRVRRASRDCDGKRAGAPERQRPRRLGDGPGRHGVHLCRGGDLRSDPREHLVSGVAASLGRASVDRAGHRGACRERRGPRLRELERGDRGRSLAHPGGG